MTTAGVASAAGIHFGPTANGKHYLSAFMHRGSGPPDKSVWDPSISPVVEYGIFEVVDIKDWRCARGSYWGFLNGAMTTIGRAGERLCKFPHTANQSDPWHGYPISPRARETDEVPMGVVKQWSASGVITESIVRRILRHKI
jgi:hypothetical protein